MPELPEVETVARQLAPCITGRRVRGARIFDPLLRNGRLPRLGGLEIHGVRRIGKQVALRFDGGPSRVPLWLSVHLRMTGRLLWTEEERPPAQPHLRAVLRLDGDTVLFVDPRRFGTWTWRRSLEEPEATGIDPVSRRLTPGVLTDLLRGSRQELKAWLLRQDRLVGLGNIYASEILHRAGLRPTRRADSLGENEIRRLHRATTGVLGNAIRHCGTTFSDFQDARGVEGSYQRYLAVYDREGLPCRRCRTPIARIVQQQRSTYYCPACQG